MDSSVIFLTFIYCELSTSDGGENGRQMGADEGIESNGVNRLFVIFANSRMQGKPTRIGVKICDP